MNSTIKRILLITGSVLFFLIALHFISGELKKVNYHEITNAARDISLLHIFAAIAFTLLNYAVLTMYDFLGTRFAAVKLSYSKIAFTSFLSYVFSNNVGLSVFGASAIRLRFYGSWSVPVSKTIQIIAFCIFTLWLGIFTAGGAALIFGNIQIPATVYGKTLPLHWIGIILLSVTLAYLILSFRLKKSLTIFKKRVTLPNGAIALTQVLTASSDWILAAAVCYFLFPSGGIPFWHFMAVFMFAQIAGLVSHVPGGLGIFEGMMIALLKNIYPTEVIIGALVLYRAVYYLMPFFGALLLFSMHEIFQSAGIIRTAGGNAARILRIVSPYFFGVSTFIAGAILIFSGATPHLEGRLIYLSFIFPLSVIEFSHFAGSMIGTALLIVGWGLLRRIDLAYYISAFMLLLGALFSLLKGLDYAEAAILLFILLLLYLSRNVFSRKASLLIEPINPVWIISIIAVITTSIWLGNFAFRHVQYSTALWWRFELSNDASRFLRANVGIALVCFIFFALRLFRPAFQRPLAPTEEVRKQVEHVVRSSATTTAWLAMIGDKYFLWNNDRTAFIMYGISGRSWIAMGDPVGPVEEHVNLIWAFIRESRKKGGLPVFYEVSGEHIEHYLETGMGIVKIGEDAVVNLENFSMAEKYMHTIYHRNRVLEKEGYRMEIISEANVPEYIPMLKKISDEWLSSKNGTEKKFSLGFFSEEYLSRCPAAIVYRNETAVAFANLLASESKNELSVDLIRYLPDVQNGIMDFLFSNLMIWGKQQGYHFFSLGMAPFSGLTAEEFSPFWYRAGNFLYSAGKSFYNFRGLRQYKNKFHPQWKARYLVLPRGLRLPSTLSDITRLINGGITGVFSK